VALPNSITNNSPAQSDLPSTLGTQIRNLKTAIEDLLGIPDATSISAAAFEIIAAGLKDVRFQDAAGNPATAGYLQRNAANLAFHDGTASRNVTFDTNTQTLSNKTLSAPAFSGTATGDILLTDATYDIGKSGATRPRDLFVSRNAAIGGTLAVTGAVTLTVTLTVAQGGTGLTTLTTNNVILGNGTSTPLFVAPGASGNVLTSNGTTWTSATALTGTLTAGTTAIQNPYASGAVVTTAHGLGVAPIYVRTLLICLTAELGYSIGDTIDYSASYGVDGNVAANKAIQIIVDATNVTIITGDAVPRILNKSTASAADITAANWKVNVIPYKLN
jgi:hypothetical protein